jgi:ribonuclease J
VAPPVTVTFLGGVGEVGRNCTCVEYGGRIVVVDCGVMFPFPTMPGVQAVLPDFTWLRSRAGDVEACVITHGHEDHIGGIVPLLRDIPVPLYGTDLTLGIARSKVEEAGLLHRTDFRQVHDGERMSIGPFDCEFLPITHSVPRSVAVVFHSPQGVLLHTGDFKLDYSPVDGRLTDLARMGVLASDPGVRLLMADSTNADVPGHSDSEMTVGETIRRLFRDYAGRRIVAACFASHLHRVQQIVDAAVSQGRTVFPLGRSMVSNVRLARELGVLELPERNLASIEQVGQFEPGQVCVICTGSQGEPNAALSLLAAGEHREFALQPDDVVILSSHPIPGNEFEVFANIDRMVRLGCDVVHSGQEHVHVTGHARRDELRTLNSVVRPRHFVPIEGEYRMLVRHAQLAREAGMAAKDVIVAVDGDQVVIDDDGIRIGGKVPGGYRYVDGIVDDIGEPVLAERRQLSREGFVAVVVTVDDRGRVVAGPHVETRGWVHPDWDHLMDEVQDAVEEALARAHRPGEDTRGLERIVRRAAGSKVHELTRRRPAIIPIVLRTGRR